MKEFADFLGGQPPFDALDPEDLTRLAAHIEVEYFAAGAVVVRPDERLDHLWVVRTGALELLDAGRVIDLLGPGDTFGHVAVLAQLPAGVLVRAHEESLCLRIPDPRGILAHPQRLNFGRLSIARRERLLGDGALSASAGPVTEVMRPVVWCRPEDRIRDVARQIGAAGQSCALVRTPAGLGIVTDHDFRHRVASGDLPLDAPVAELASTPVLTIGDGATRAAAFLQMVEHGVHHLVVTDPAGEAVGVVRVVDMARVEVRDPLLIRAAVETARTLDALAEACRSLPGTIVALRDHGVPGPHAGAVHAAIVDAVVRRVLALRPEPPAPQLARSWVLLGSLARREPLPRSDVDTALVWADPPTPAEDPADAIRAEAASVLADLRHCGFEPCPSGANADNPLFSRSRSAWATAARRWLHDPSRDGALLLSAMVADSRPLTEIALGRHLTDVIRSHTRTTQFLRALLDEALGWRPPTGFVRDFVVQHTGEHRGQLDLKRGGLAPVVALGRWIAIATGDSRGTTPERLRRGGAAGLLTRDETETLVGGFESIYTLVLDHEVEAIRAGVTPATFLAPRDLDSLTRRHLRESFRAIARVQARVDVEWMHRLPG